MGDYAEDTFEQILHVDDDQLTAFRRTAMREEGFWNKEDDPEYGMEAFYDLDFKRFPMRISGPGACPKCGGATVEKVGKFGSFYGCASFPKCNGSRSA